MTLISTRVRMKTRRGKPPPSLTPNYYMGRGEWVYTYVGDVDASG